MRWGRRIHGGPGRATRWIALLFMAGSTLFAVGSFPITGRVASAAAVGMTFFVGSIAFTAAAAGQLGQAAADLPWPPRTRSVPAGVAPAWLAWWAALVQLVGTLLFNLSTGDAMVTNLDTQQVNRLVWAPDLFGSVAFLLASALGWWVVCGPRWCRRPDDPTWWMAVLNGTGSVFFMVSAVAAVTVPTTGEPLNLAVVNSTTVVGALCFLGGAWLLLPTPGAGQDAEASTGHPGHGTRP